LGYATDAFILFDKYKAQMIPLHVSFLFKFHFNIKILFKWRLPSMVRISPGLLSEEGFFAPAEFRFGRFFVCPSLKTGFTELR
jgi:hypothetical protein